MFKHLFTPTLLVTLLIGGTMTGHSAAEDWRSFYFDGNGFREGKEAGAVAILVREGRIPLVATGEKRPTDVPLPAGTGAVAGICYLQKAGGKLRSSSGFVPLSGAVVEFDDGNRKFAVRSDGRGYFLCVLPAAEYDVRMSGFTRKLRIETGKTELIAFRGGKRMVD